MDASASSAQPPEAKRRKLPAASAASSSSVDPALALMASSLVLCTPDVERALRDALAAAVERIGISVEAATRMISLLADARAAAPLGFPDEYFAQLVYLAPIHPSLRALSVTEIAAAWEVCDYLYLCAHPFEEDLVQRYFDDPACLPGSDWRAAIGTAAHPAREMLWDQLSSLHGRVRSNLYISTASPAPLFGSPIDFTKKRGIRMLNSMDPYETLRDLTTMARRLHVVPFLCAELSRYMKDHDFVAGALSNLAPLIVTHVTSIMEALVAEGYPSILFAALSTHAQHLEVVRTACNHLTKLASAFSDGPGGAGLLKVIIPGVPALLSVLARYPDDAIVVAGVAACLAHGLVYRRDAVFPALMECGAIPTLATVARVAPNDAGRGCIDYVHIVASLNREPAGRSAFKAASGEVVFVAAIQDSAAVKTSLDLSRILLEYALASDGEPAGAIVHAGGVPVCVNALRIACARDAVFIAEAHCALLQRLLAWQPDLCIAAGMAGALTVLVDALQLARPQAGLDSSSKEATTSLQLA